MKVKEIINELNTWFEKRRKYTTQKAFDKWYIQNRIDELHKYLFDNNYIDKEYFHKQLDDILEKVDKLQA